MKKSVIGTIMVVEVVSQNTHNSQEGAIAEWGCQINLRK